MRKSLIALVVLNGWLLLHVGGCRAAESKMEKSAKSSAAERKTAVEHTRESTPAIRPKTAVKAEPGKTLATGSETAGHLVVDRQTYDFGQVEPGQKVEGKFVLANDGKGPVKIHKVGKSCGCTVTNLNTKELKPGESTVLGITYTAGHRPGKTSKRLWVNVEPPSEPTKLTMSIVAEVKRIVDYKPARWEFELRQSPQNETPLQLENMDGQAFSIIRCVSTGQAVKVLFDPNVKATKFSLPIKVDFARLRKMREGAVTVGFKGARVRDVTVPFRVKMPFEAKPSVRYFRDLESGKEKKARITVVSNYGEPFEIESVSSEHGLIKVLDHHKHGEDYQIDIALTQPEDSKRRILNDYLVIKIKDHPEDILRVHCYGKVGKTKVGRKH